MKIKILIVCLTGLLFCGCVSTQYVPYAGKQTGWRTADGAFVRNDYKLPIYDGYPDKPYLVLGRLTVSSRHDPDYTAVSQAIWHKAEALIVISSQTQYGGSMNFGSASANTFGNTTMASGWNSSAATYIAVRQYLLIQFTTTPSSSTNLPATN